MDRRKYFKKYHTMENNPSSFDKDEYFKSENDFIKNFKGQFSNFDSKKDDYNNYEEKFKYPRKGNYTSKTIITKTKIGPDGIPITETHETKEISELDKYGNPIESTKKIYSNNNLDYDMEKVNELRAQNNERVREAKKRDQDFGDFKNYEDYKEYEDFKKFGGSNRYGDFDSFKRNNYGDDFGKNFDYEITERTVRNGYEEGKPRRGVNKGGSIRNDYYGGVSNRVRKREFDDEIKHSKERVKKRMNNLDSEDEGFRKEDHSDLIKEWNRVASCLNQDISEW